MKTYIRTLQNLTILILFLLSIPFAQAQVTISGTITTEEAVPLSNVMVILSGTLSDIEYTDENGNYEFEVPEGANYVVTPFHDLDHINGVTTLDVVTLGNHITGQGLLDSPYKLIAADINNSGTISAIDVVHLEQLVTGVISVFPNTTSWRFVDVDFVFADPTDPFTAPFPEVASINIAQDDVTGVDFIGVKMGDLNNSASPLLSIGPCQTGCGQLTGRLSIDENSDCLSDDLEPGLENWLVTIESDSLTHYLYTDEDGTYSLIAFPGEYTVSVSPPNNLWTLCQNNILVSLTASANITADFGAQALLDCPQMTVDIETGFLRRCMNSFYIIEYCNDGTVPADDASIELTFDPLFEVISSSMPWVNQNGSTYTFDLGTVGVNECDLFYVEGLINCDAELGVTLCAEALVFPDTICVPPTNFWDGATLEVEAFCEGDSVRFDIKNIGESMIEAVNYIVIEDDMIMLTGDNDPIQLAANTTTTIHVPANGSTWRLELDQTMNHPLAEAVSAAIEGCGVNGSGETSIGFINQFPQLTLDPFVDVHCDEVIGSWDPNDKAAFPIGVDEAHYIEKNTDLDYRIRFQNTGTDTAFAVVIRDTLSEWLDVSSINPGPSSHPYTIEFVSERIIEFSFPNIMLPDSNVNEVASHGFVKFEIAQRTDNPLGTVIENTAGIYFDFNEPVITNTVFHTIGENFLDILNNVLLQPNQHFDMRLFPNLIDQSTTLTLEGAYLEKGSFLLYDLSGRLIRQQNFTGSSIEFSKKQLNSGMYIFEIQDRGLRLSTGKLMIR